MTWMLHPAVSFRSYAEFTILSHHGTGRWMRLSASAGPVLSMLENGETPAEAFEPFLQALAQEQVLVTPQDAEAFTQHILGDEEPVSNSRGQKASSAAPSKLLDELNDYAATRLVPLHAHLALTHRCPLSCKHCYLAGQATLPTQELSTERLRHLMDELAAMGGYFLAFTGGEPALRPDLEELVRYARKLRFAVSLFTSGFGMTPKRWRRLAAMGLDGVQVSIHGSDAARHDAFTGVRGSFDAAMQGLLLAQGLGVPVRAAVTLHKNNVDDAEDIAALLDGKRIPWNMAVSLWPRLNGDRSPCALQLNDAELERLLAMRPERSRFRMAGLSLDDPPCSAGRNTLAVSATGTLQPCTAWVADAGDLTRQSFADIWRDSALLAEVRALTVGDLQACATCESREFCNRCTGLAILEGKEIFDHSLLDCKQAEVYHLKKSSGNNNLEGRD